MLEGRLSEFRLGEVFQLLAWTHKSGALTVDAGARRGRVDFTGGQVAFAVADVRRAELGARLANAGIVSDEALRRVVEAQQSGLGRIAEVLLDEGLAEPVVDDLLREHVQDAVFTLMRTADGGFTFQPADEFTDLAGPKLDTEALIAEGARRLEEWEEVRARIPSPDAVLGMTPNPPVDGDSVTVSVDQWRLLVLVDGSRSVAELVELTGQGEFATSQVLAELAEAGLLDAVDPDDGDTGLGELLARRESLRELETSQLGMPAAPAQPEPEAADLPVADVPVADVPVADVPVADVPEPDAGPDLALVPEPGLWPEEPAPAFEADGEPVEPFELEPAPVFDGDPAPEPESVPALDPMPEPGPGWRSEAGAEAEPAWGSEAGAEAEPAWTPSLEAAHSALDGEAGDFFGDPAGWDTDVQSDGEFPNAGSEEEPAAVGEPEIPQELREEPQGLDGATHVFHDEHAGSGLDSAPRPGVDRVQVARELASLGFEGPPAAPAPTTDEPPRRLTRDEDVTRGLLVRLMDGVRKA